MVTEIELFESTVTKALCISIIIICMQCFNNLNYTQKHYKGPDDGTKPKLVARML